MVSFTDLDPENTRGGEVNGEPYVQPSLFMHILKSLKPGLSGWFELGCRSGSDSCSNSSILLITSISFGASR